MVVVVDINPYGHVEDLFLPQQEGLEKLSSALDDKPESVEVSKDGVISVEQQRLNLRIIKSLGGNQFNVWQNLDAMQRMFPKLQVRAHFGLPDRAPQRRNLILANREGYFPLETPNTEGEILFEADLSGSSLVVSSAPPDVEGSRYWTAMKKYLASDPEKNFYWNPGSKQINGGLQKATYDAIGERTRIFQVNESEYNDILRRYGELPGAEWIVITRGPEGLTLKTREGGEFSCPAEHRVRLAKAFLHGKWVDANPTGCGDVVFSTLIAARESWENVDPQYAIRLAAQFAKIQFHNPGSNFAYLSKQEHVKIAV